MEVSLIRLLNDFNEGRLRAFDVGNSFESLDAAREMQEGLSERHFEMDGRLEQLDKDAPHQDRVPSLQSKEGQSLMKEETGDVMRKLRDLSFKIQSLHKARPPGGTSGTN
ncbi:hypothetical protein BOX15_Mlig000820g2 [Macrostomum lignano]|uniref:Uncharacterized protein n=1 Tax=Macrostomum lignano TaxID=282301 RepID=A0A267H401_9PLAT|nr:hypothetical protein BOX15_Mlig000820g2 [Macrostomum lignano]